MVKNFLIEKIKELQILNSYHKTWRRKKTWSDYQFWIYNTFELIDLYFTYKRILKRKLTK